MKTKKQHIIILTSEFPPQPGGIGNHAYNLALQLSKNDYEVSVIADQRSNDGLEEHQFDASLPFTVRRIKITSPRFFMYLKRIVELFRLLKCANQVIATGKFSLWSAAFCSYFFNRNYIAIIHGTEVNFKKGLLRASVNIALKKFDIIIAVSNYTKNLVAYLNLDVKVIHNGFNPEKWLVISPSSSHIQGNPKLTTVGNITSRKGQKNVIKQLPKLLEQFPDLHYHCVGLKTEAENFKNLAKQLHVEKHVSFHGRLSEDELHAVLSDTDIFVMLSTETSSGDVEGFGIAILEANALGIPAIGATDCGIEDAINVNNSGLLINPYDSDEFVIAIHTILNNRENFENGAKSWAKEHQWSDIVQQYIEYLQ